MKMRFSVIVVGLVAFSAVACGGSSSDGSDGSSKPGTVDSNLPSGTALGELTDAQVDELCKQVGEAAQDAFQGADFMQATCDYTAFVAASIANDPELKCEDIRAECLKTPPETEEPSEDSCSKPSASCSATVGEYEACMTAVFEQFKGTLAAMPGCDDIGSEVTPMEPGEIALPAACAALQEKCPEATEGLPTAE